MWIHENEQLEVSPVALVPYVLLSIMETWKKTGHTIKTLKIKKTNIDHYPALGPFDHYFVSLQGLKFSLSQDVFIINVWGI